jgi:cysteine desulfurase
MSLDLPDFPIGPVYLDCNATTPVDEEVAAAVLHFMKAEFGNAGSRTHEHGARAKRAVQEARRQVAAVVAVTPDEVIFTSGATESNNLALLGLADHGLATGRTHIVSSLIEHKAVLEPLERLSKKGFEVSLVAPDEFGRVSVDAIRRVLKPSTLLVSLMHVNNETGVIQPVSEVASVLQDSQIFLHVDAAQGFGKDLEALRNPRIDLISVSGHKLYAPKGIGALIARRRGFERPPLVPLIFGGGQERGLRGGTLPVPLIVGLGLASAAALRDKEGRTLQCLAFREKLVTHVMSWGGVVHGRLDSIIPNTLNFHFPGLDSEAVMLALKDLVEISNGSACTSQNYTASHVLQAMGMSNDAVRGALRVSWFHETPEPDWVGMERALAKIA